ncbi:MAG TPA: AbfB domain-containing protein, partial [Roseiflexaceae bacterium]|nr:AbfB domain-containing protein [Roseiflexaceae bacterium]
STYYMVSTTMHFNPGVPIMKSSDLVNWEIAGYVYDTLENGDRQNLNNGQNEYGNGSWAASLRYRSGRFYVVFGSLTSGRTYIYQTTNIETGPWTRSTLNSLYHDPSLLFDDDGRVYLTYGGGDIRIIELTADATAVKAGGLNQIIIPNAGAIAGSGGLAAEGSHIQKINGRYYVFLISWPSGGMRTQLVYRSDRINGGYQGQIMLRNSGIAQGGVVDTPDGRWYALLFRDYGAVGRIPYLVPMTWSNAWPVLGDPFDTGISVNLASKYVASDEFNSGTKPGLMWQWNHNPDNALWSLTARPGFFRLTNGSVRSSLLHAKNTLTQRTFGPESSAVVAVETGGMKDGDYAGLAALQFYYGFVGVKMSGTAKSIVMVRGSTNNASQASTPVEVASVPLGQSRVYFKVYTDYRNRTDKASFFYSLDGNQWTAIGGTLQMAYTLPHFVGYRFALFTYATRSTGGAVDFDYYRVQPGNTVSPQPTPTPAPGGTVRQLQSYNFQSRYLRHQGYRARIDENVSPAQDSQFRVVPGLANSGAISFESVNFPGRYLRHRNGEIWLDANDGTSGFGADATWHRRAGLANSGWSSYESYNLPGQYMRHSNYLMFLGTVSGSLQQADATFREQ